MPRTRREYLLRFADQASNDLDRALEKLQQLSATYEPVHPEHAKYVDLVAAQILEAKDNLTLFKEKFM